MKKTLICAAAAVVVTTGAVQAEGEQFNGFYTVGEIGYENGAGGFDQFIYGGVLGGNLKLGEQFFIGVEGEVFGSTSDLIDFTYGGHGQLGYIINEKHAIFARAGYREFEFDVDGFGSFSSGDYSLGLGGQYQIHENVSIRTIVDTVAFDTIGVRTGVVFHF